MAGRSGEDSGPRAQLRLLGDVRLLDASGAPVRLASRRARALLALLSLEGAAGVARDRICGLLWSDRGNDQARASLRQCLFELKSALGDLGDAALDVARERIVLRPGVIGSDVDRIHRLLALGGRADIGALTPLLDAGALLEGLELPGLFDEWREQTRAAFEASLLSAVLQRLDALAADGDWDFVRTLAEAYLRRDPLQEAVAATAIRADMATGQPAAAKRRFQALERALRDELGVAPGPRVAQALAAAPAAAPAQIAPPAAPPAGPTLAVLAFEDLSPPEAQDYFADGLSEEILHGLSRALDLPVIARSSSFQLRGAEKSPAAAGARLGATHVLDGSVRRAGSRVRISIQLTACADGRPLWSERFDRELTDAFALQDEIAAAVAAALKVTLAPPAPPSPVDTLAYELFLRARALDGSPRAAQARIELLEAAIARAPDFAQAWAALAQARALQARHGPRPRPFVMLKAEALQAAERALALDPGSGSTYASLSLLQPWAAYAEREALLTQALRLAPHDPATNALMGAFYNHVGRLDLALAHLRRAYQLDPLDPLTADIYGAVLGATDHPDGTALYAAWRERWPGHLTFSLGHMNVLMFQGDWALYDEVAQIAAATAGTSPEYKATQGIAQSLRTGDPELRPRIARRLARSADELGAIPLHQIATAAALGLNDEIFAALDRASYDFMREEDGAEPASIYNPGVIFDRHFCTGLMRDPRFVALCHKLGLCRYWAAADAWPDCADDVADAYDFRAAVRACG